tara:strand:- start:97260 stop:98018 length:759 start_codon:yes stop_codon:yes gene_type:complete
MKLIKYTIIQVVLLSLSSAIDYVRIAIIPEYDNPWVTTLISGRNFSDPITNKIQMTIPNKPDTVFSINVSKDGNLEFNDERYFYINGIPTVITKNNISEFAYMINGEGYTEPGDRKFLYQISFSEEIKQLELEIQEPLGGENFSYSGFFGKEDEDSQGIVSHKTILRNVPADLKREISLSYQNNTGLNTNQILGKKIIDKEKFDNEIITNKKKIIRHKLYTWEPILALIVITIIAYFTLRMKRVSDTGFKKL